MAKDKLADAAIANNFTEFTEQFKIKYGDDHKDGVISNSFQSYRAAYKGSSGGHYSEAIEGKIDIGDILKKSIESQTIDKGGDEGEFIGLQDAMKVFYDSSKNRLRTMEEMGQALLNVGVQGLITYYGQQAKLQNQINEKTSLTGEMSKDFRDSIMESSVYANRLGISFDDVTAGMVKLITDSGRFKLINEETINKLSLTSKAFFDSYDEGVGSLEQFQKVSRGVSDAMEAVEKTGKSSLSLGLNAKSTVKVLVEKLNKLNQFGFQNGINGLTKMVQKAQSLRMSLDTTFNLAKKVMDPTDALSLAANLQVIGGALGAFNDPIRMMWMATNNVEGLQDALAETAESLVTFNHESGAFEIVGADLRRAHAMASELGMELSEITDLAVQSAQRTSAAADLMTTGLILEEEDREFLTNISQMKSGRMVIETKDKSGNDIEIALESMTNEQANYLLSQKEQFKKMSTMDIARHQVTLIENLERDVSFLAATARMKAGEELTGAFIDAGYDPTVAAAYAKEFTDDAQTSLLNLVGDSNNEVKQLINAANEKKSTENTRGQISSNISGTLNHNLSSRVSYGPFWREVLRDPIVQKAFNDNLRHYLNKEG